MLCGSNATGKLQDYSNDKLSHTILCLRKPLGYFTLFSFRIHAKAESASTDEFSIFDEGKDDIDSFLVRFERSEVG